MTLGESAGPNRNHLDTMQARQASTFLIPGAVLLALAGTSRAAGSPTTPAPAEAETPVAATSVVSSRLLDLNGDGAPDLLLQHADRSLSVRLHSGARSFIDVPQELPRTEVTDALVTDLDGDGLVDLYLVTPAADVALLGGGGGLFRDATLELGLIEDGVGVSAERVDLDLDGLPELVVHNRRSDVLFWARGDGRFVREALSPSTARTAPTSSSSVAGDEARDQDVLGARGVTQQRTSPAGSAFQVGVPRRLALAAPATGTQTATAAPATSFQSFFDPIYVNDNAGEVDSADIADGSLTGADVSTSSGDVTFAGAVLTARQGVFGVGSITAGSGSTISGGANNQTAGQFSVISGGLTNQAAGDHSVVSGGQLNVADAQSATVSGGRENRASGAFSTVGGGFNNIAFMQNAFVGGGIGNVALQNGSTVAGGNQNRAEGDSASVGGGNANDATGLVSTIAGGANNLASGIGAFIPGGTANNALGDTSCAAGTFAEALHDGSFVWGDSSSGFGNKVSSAADQFNVFADGGVRMFAEGTTTPSFELSDAGKTRIVDGTEGLDRVLTSDANGEASWGMKLSSGTYTPTWTNLEGITGAPFTIEAHYTRVGDMVTVLVVNNFPTFAIGTNRATITLPPGLPVASGFPESFLVSGSFTNDWYRHGSEQNCGAVVHEDSTHVRLVLMNATQSGGATAFCNFTYLTDAP